MNDAEKAKVDEVSKSGAAALVRPARHDLRLRHHLRRREKERTRPMPEAEFRQEHDGVRVRRDRRDLGIGDAGATLATDPIAIRLPVIFPDLARDRSGLGRRQGRLEVGVDRVGDVDQIREGVAMRLLAQQPAE
jgi:hypothetical protein